MQNYLLTRRSVAFFYYLNYLKAVWKFILARTYFENKLHIWIQSRNCFNFIKHLFFFLSSYDFSLTWFPNVILLPRSKEIWRNSNWMEHTLVICITNINNSNWMEHKLMIYVTNINNSNWMEHTLMIYVTNFNNLNGTHICDLCH